MWVAVIETPSKGFPSCIFTKPLMLLVVTWANRVTGKHSNSNTRTRSSFLLSIMLNFSEANKMNYLGSATLKY
jgi:hypothetical protein